MIEIDRMPRFTCLDPFGGPSSISDRRERKCQEYWQKEREEKDRERERERKREEDEKWERFKSDADKMAEMRKTEPYDFKPAKDFGLGPGKAREIEDYPLVERFRYDDHEPYGKHLNYEVILPKKNRRTIGLSNSHISLDDEDDL